MQMFVNRPQKSNTFSQNQIACLPSVGDYNFTPNLRFKKQFETPS